MSHVTIGIPLGWSANGRLYYMNGREIWEVAVGPRGPILTRGTRDFRLPAGIVGQPAVLPGGDYAVAIRGGRILSDLVVVEGALRRR